jgi:hypothetical protein
MRQLADELGDLHEMLTLSHTVPMAIAV